MMFDYAAAISDLEIIVVKRHVLEDYCRSLSNGQCKITILQVPFMRILVVSSL